MKLPPYPSYEPNGVAWLGDVPEHWDVKRGRFCMAVNPYAKRLRALQPEDEVSFVPMEAVGEYGGLNLEQTKPVADIGSGYTQFQDGDIVVAKITPCFENGKGSLAKGLLNGVAIGTTELHVLRPMPNLNRRFLFYFTISRLFRDLGESEMYGTGGQKRIPTDFCKDVQIPLAPVIEQRAIADFLDRETTKIDALVAKKQTLIERLKEKRTALVSRVVTRGLPPDAATQAGLDPHPKLKSSGVAWLGDVPEHWDVKRLKWSASINDEALAEKTDPAFEMIYVDIGSVDAIRGITAVSNVVFEDAPSRARRIVRDGDTIVSTVRTYLRAITTIHDPSPNTVVSTGFAVIRPRQIFAGFMSYALREKGFVDMIVAHSVGVSYPAVNASEIGALPIPLPPKDEQHTIADYLDCETAKIDMLEAKIEAAIDRLREYRAALITAAVTGKIDVRNGVSSNSFEQVYSIGT